MLKLYSKHLHRALNVAIIVAGALFVTSLVQSYQLTTQPQARRITVAGVDFSRSEKTLLLFLQQDCKVCIESVAFYRRITDNFPDPGNVQLILITPNEPKTAGKFFRNEGLPVATVLQGERGLLGVKLSPTLILADSTGIVRGSWIGQLSPEREAEVLTMLGN